MPVRKYRRGHVSWDCAYPDGCFCWAQGTDARACIHSVTGEPMQAQTPKSQAARKDLRADLKEIIEQGDSLKKDSGKARYDLIPPHALEALADLYALGAAKYEDRGWEQGMGWGRIFGAMMRHAWKWWGREKHDPIDGQHHLISVAWCAFALYEYERRKIGEDSRA